MRTLPTTTRRVRTDKFDSLEYADRYVFPDDGHIYRASTGRKLWPRTNKETGYKYYRLTRDDGKRVTVSAALVSGRITKVGDLFFTSYTPRNTHSHSNWPAYVFDLTNKRIYRVGFLGPRIKPMRVNPNKKGEVTLRDYAGTNQTLQFDEIFS